MSLYIDIKYAQLLSPKLQRFVRKRTNLFNFRCPFCLDSKKSKIKARGYLYPKRNDLFFRCHNCGYSTTMSKFLKSIDITLYKNYIMERFVNDGNVNNANYKKPKVVDVEKYFKKIKTSTKLLVEENKKISLPTINDLEDHHIAKQYIKNRLIPETFWNELYYTDDFKSTVESLSPHKYTLKQNDPRIIIPFYNKQKQLIGLQGRSITNSVLKYITIKLIESEPKIFGLDRLDETKQCYVVEGPFDSLFIPNCIAAGGSDIDLNAIPRNSVFIFDNEPRNIQIINRMENIIFNGFTICIWPDNITNKDINDMILGGFSKEDILEIINKNCYSGLKAKIKLIKWKKCN